MFIRVIKDSVLRFKKESILILISSILGAFLQIGAVGQIIYYARALETGKALDLLGYQIAVRSGYSFSICMTALFLLLLSSAFLVYYSRSKIIGLACSYETFCSKRVFSIIAYLRGVCSAGILLLYDDRSLLSLARSDARFCGRILRMLIMLVQPSATFVIALAALFYINFLLTMSVLLITSISVFFHYKNNLKGISSSRKLERHAAGAAKEKVKVLRAAMGVNRIDDDFFKWMGEHYTSGEISRNLEGYRGRFQTLEKAKFINDIAMAMILSVVAVIIGGSAIIHNAHWGRLIVYLIALRYCFNHLKTVIITFTSINRFYPQFSRYFHFVDSFNGTTAKRDIVTQSYKIMSQSSPFRDCESSAIITKGDILAVVGPFEFNFYNIPIYMNSLLGHEGEAVREILRSMNVIGETDGYIQGLSFRELFCVPGQYNLETLQGDLLDYGISEEIISHLPGDLDKPISREKWDAIELGIRYSVGLLSAIRSSKQWVVIDERVLEHLSQTTRDRFFKGLEEKITLLVFDGQLNNVGICSKATVAVTDGRKVIGLGDVPWFEAQKKDIQEKMDLAKERYMRIQKQEKEEEEGDDELDEDI